MTREHHKAGLVAAVDLLPVQREIADAGIGIFDKGDAGRDVTRAVTGRDSHRRQIEQTCLLAEQFHVLDRSLARTWCRWDRLAKPLPDVLQKGRFIES